MNQKKRRQYSLANARKVKKWEATFTSHINKVLKNQVAGIVSILREKGIHAAQSETHKIIMVDGLASALQRLYIFVGIQSAKRVLREVNLSARQKEKKAGFGFDEIWISLIKRFFELYLLEKAVSPISKETRRLILAILEKGITDGWGIDQMADFMTSDSFTMARARLIARTEITKAQFYGEELGVEASEWETEEQWISAHDHRVRSSHRKVDGETIPSGGKFKVDVIRNNVVVDYDMMKGPGDPEAHVENIIQCRCVRSFVARRDERGRLIPKQKKFVDLHSLVAL